MSGTDAHLPFQPSHLSTPRAIIARFLFLKPTVLALLLPSHHLSLRSHMPPASTNFHMLTAASAQASLDISPKLHAHMFTCYLLNSVPWGSSGHLFLSLHLPL